MDLEDKALADVLTSDLRKRRENIVRNLTTDDLTQPAMRHLQGQVKAFDHVLEFVANHRRKSLGEAA